MTLSSELQRVFPDSFRILILDNEVTVDAFVTEPPLPWARLVADGGTYRVADGYPTRLTEAEADREERNWDRVSNAAIRAGLSGLDESVGLVAFGNNAGQGMPLADALPAPLRSSRGVVVYGRSLPEQPAYRAMGFARFCPRAGLLDLIRGAAADRPVALAFINTIEHNVRNYHAPWPG